MRKPLPWSGRTGLLLLLPAALLPLLLAQPRSFQAVPTHSSFHDWTTHHAVYPHVGTLAALQAVEIDPRARFRWQEIEQQEQWRDFERFRRRRLPPRPRRQPGIQRDWSINLGTAGTAPAMYPAKFSFDVTAAPSCANDFVVFPVNAKGGAAQPNLVAFNNLYSGTAAAGGIGKCNRAATANDIGTAATVLWSYNVHAIVAGGAVPTSPVLSLDGKKVAFVESAAGSAAHFHVLAWKANDGQVANLQNVLVPKAITTFSNPSAPAAGSGTASDLALGLAGTDTLSSPFIDYANDTAYIGNDSGVLYRVKNVFCTTAGCAGAAPSLDNSWGTSGALSIGGTCTAASAQLTGPVLDFASMTVYVGCADGKLYSVSQTGTIKSLAVGDGVGSKAFGGMVDSPIVDSVNQFVYATSGSANAGANGVLVQAKLDLSAPVAVPIGNGNQCNLHSPTFSNAYFTNPTLPASIIYIGGVTGTVGPCTATGATGGLLQVYGATFRAGGVLNAGAPAHRNNVGNPGNEFAPMTEFFNPNIGGGRDFLFFAVLTSGNDMASYNITAGFPGGLNSGPITSGFGTSGMVVDNSALTTAGNFPQASSLYFNALGENAACTGNTGGNTTPGTGGCAIKLTQAALQ
jgi:hypothetical protein